MSLRKVASSVFSAACAFCRSPFGLGWRDWWLVFRGSFSTFFEDDCLTYSAAITFYFILSFFPMVLLLLSLGGFLLQYFAAGYASETELYARVLSFVHGYFPFLTMETVNKLDIVVEGRGTMGFVGICALLLASTLSLGALEQALRRIFEVKPRHFVVSKLLVGLFIFCAGSLLVLSLVFTSILTELLGKYVPFMLQVKSTLASFPVMSYLTPLALLIITFVVLVKYFLGRGIGWRLTFAGGVMFSALFVIARSLYGLYLWRLSNLNALYGSLTAVVILVSWVFYVSNIALFSAGFMKVLGGRWGGRAGPRSAGCNTGIAQTEKNA